MSRALTASSQRSAMLPVVGSPPASFNRRAVCIRFHDMIVQFFRVNVLS